MNAWNWLWALLPAVLSTITHCSHWLQIAWEWLYLDLSNTDFQRFRSAFVDRLSLQKTSFQDYERIIPNKTFLRKIIIAHECVWLPKTFVWRENSVFSESNFLTPSLHQKFLVPYLVPQNKYLFLTQGHQKLSPPVDVPWECALTNTESTWLWLMLI